MRKRRSCEPKCVSVESVNLTQAWQEIRELNKRFFDANPHREADMQSVFYLGAWFVLAQITNIHECRSVEMTAEMLAEFCREINEYEASQNRQHNEQN